MMNTHIFNETVLIEQQNQQAKSDRFNKAIEQWFIDNQVSFEALPGLLELINEHFKSKEI